MKKALFALFLFAIALQSCDTKPETVSNNDIDPKLREVIKAKNDSLFEALSNSSTKVFSVLGSDRFNENLTANLSDVIWPFRKGMLETDHEVYEEFYSKHTKVNHEATILSSQHNYKLQFINQNYETYVSLLKSTYRDVTDYLVTVIYAKIDNKWKITHITMGALGAFNKDANNLFSDAKGFHNNGYDIDALHHASIANGYLEPAKNLIKYSFAKDIDDFIEKLANEINRTYPLPDTLSQIQSKPVILNFNIIQNAEGVFPLISYESQIAPNDETSLNDEFEVVKKEIQKKYKIDYSQKFVYYRAYNKNAQGLLSESKTFTETK
ncbi:hypothetical protein GN157_00380 [Flavobacterium rakeshii]|uniref:Uncharacterized protein n=1 Tax=Flavobacterium rakeshii TaxID=1038845 RepID=A0A6N8H897_9FLAO|nr:hypothetical protein [Flavobacterium rakeshii]MUV02153.1 hypothetical protein [Flavobacterium rakeshii]